MVQVHIVKSPAFLVMGKKTWIQVVDDFHTFWSRCHEDGTINRLTAAGGVGPVTKGLAFGISCVEKDPSIRTFDFYIAVEVPGAGMVPAEFTSFTIPAATWAVFECRGEMLEALYEAEMYAFTQWLPASDYEHALAPELEVYPAKSNKCVQFWLPIVCKEVATGT